MKNISHLHLSSEDWLKLSDFNKVISKKILRALPNDWKLPIEDIESAVYDTIIKLGSNYKDGPLSFCSYCYKYAYQYTLRDLIAEYKRLKNQETLDLLYGEDFDDSDVHHKVVKIDESLVYRESPDKVSHNIQISELMDKMPLVDKLIANMIMNGYSYEEIAKNVGLTRDGVYKRMRKYSKI